MCICMLRKRTNILFDETTFNYLVLLAEKRKKSIGALVRQAVTEVYMEGNNHQISERKKALRSILQRRKKLKPLGIDIVELVQMGRKFDK